MGSETGNGKPTYWQVKAAFLEAKLAVAEAEARLAAVLRAAGLDPAQPYTLVDADESIRPVLPPGQRSA